ncbi:MAG: ATP synthase F1 subunit gamma [Myxococcales bacterium]|nr:ATP synthase F1 subunit gamma [Myxococcales bacterium]
MPSLKSIRKRISSVKNTQKITKAMKMVAAAKLRRAQDAALALRPYAQHLSQIASDVAERFLAEPQVEDLLSSPTGGAAAEGAAEGGMDPKRLIQKILLGQNESRIRLVVVSADRGLAGAYNSALFRRCERFFVDQQGVASPPSIDLVVLGKKGRDYFRRRPVKIVQELVGVEPKTAKARAKELGTLLGDALLRGETDAIYVCYNEFKSVASQAVRIERILPLRLRPTVRRGEEPADEPKNLIDFEYEPGRDAVLEHLLPLYLEAELTRIMLEAIAAEFSARMRAMDSASRNAKEMIGRLTLQYNRARQAAITKELMEIIGGAEALKG